ncbi:hypothetical protein [Yoonia vestfoldensis]|uniref:Uncharacterized protein n=1 Tax=Yoonia vestfoldensis SKA53 TaxID=314232 RepID=A3V5I4_9RHOB|nr:hypothetical protein [Yoonia vestfoldensis]EAQ06902.1 hypothetical protein SKA53_15181 [Yoonia vestfoldensis SKA53]
MKKYTIRHDKDEAKGAFRGDGRLAFGITLGVLGVVLAFIAFEFFAGVKDRSEYLHIAPLIISLLVAAGSTYFAAYALLEQRRAREASTDPVLIVHLGQRSDARELITFNVTNVGAGAALNVLLDVDEPDDDNDDRPKRNYLRQIFKPHHPFAVILQGNSIALDFALGWFLLGQECSGQIDREKPQHPLPPFQARLSYEDLAGGKYESEFTIDVRELRGLGASKSPEMRMVTALETIAKKS